MAMPCPLCKLPLSQFQAYDAIYMDYNYYTKIDFGNKLYKTTYDYYNEALSFENAGNYKKSLELFEKALNSALNEDIPPKYFISFLYAKIGISCGKLENYDKALMAFARTIDIELVFQNGDETKVYNYYLNMAVVYKLKGDYLNAIVYYKKCVEINLKMVEECHPDISDLHFIIAECYELLNNYEDALLEYILSAEIYRNNVFNITFGRNDAKAIGKAKHMATLIKKENQLPEWMRNI